MNVFTPLIDSNEHLDWLDKPGMVCTDECCFKKCCKKYKKKGRHCKKCPKL